MPPEDKDAALFPRRFDGRWAMIHRPVAAPRRRPTSGSRSRRTCATGATTSCCSRPATAPGGTRARSAWGRRRWRRPRAGCSCYHGVHVTSAGPIYRLGLALLDLEDPRDVLRRTDEWVFGPAAPYERSGDVDKVVFPTGWVHDPETDMLSMYYGAGDTVIALATARLRDVLDHLTTSPRPERRRSTERRQLVGRPRSGLSATP